MLARYGGEEFFIVLAETDREGATSIAEGIRASIEALNIPHKGTQIGKVLTISVGVATTVSDGEASQTQLIEAADQVLYRAKREGRNRVIIQNSDSVQGCTLANRENNCENVEFPTMIMDAGHP